MSSRSGDRVGRRMLLLGCGIAVGLSLWFHFGMLSAEEAATSVHLPSRTRQKAGSQASVSSDEARLESKLEKILANEQAILQKCDMVKEELRVIKVRASSRGAISP